MKIKYSIVIPTYNHLEDCLKPCIESVLKYTDMCNVEIVVSCNGCTDDTREYLSGLPKEANIKIVWSDMALGYTRATNDGIKATSGEFVILLNNDTVILPQSKNKWIEILIDPIIVGRADITGPLMSYCPHAERSFLIFFCVAMRKDIFGKVGLLDERYSPGGGEDTSFCIEAENLGYRILQVPEGEPTYPSSDKKMMITSFPIYHAAEATMLDKEHAEEWHKIVERNSKKLQQRYKLPDGWFYPDDIKEYRRLANLVPEGGTICELGCNKGRSICSISDIIKRRKLNVTVVDTFEGTENEKTEEQKLIRTDFQQEFEDNLKRFEIDAKVFRGKTDDIHSLIEDRSIDLLFIDADHSYEAVKSDISNWEVKCRGTISGHDYTNIESVKKAVDEKYSFIKVGGSVWSKNLKEINIENYKKDIKIEEKRKYKVLAYINTYKRYDTTLSMSIMSVVNQTYKPDKIIIFDDNKEPKDPREIEHYRYLFYLIVQKGIELEYVWGHKKGAHYSHEMANMKGFDLAWFIDDDCVADPNCLKELINEMGENVGAVGGLILQPPASPLPPNAANIIDDLYLPNIQWFIWDGPPRKVEHIYSSFLYRCGIVHHDLRLSSVVFRGETMFTHSLLLKGYDLIIAPKAITWHFQSQGGIHSGQQIENWQHDEKIFRDWLDFQKTGKQLFVLDNGIGDHYAFKTVLPKIRSYFSGKKIVLAVCYPEIFCDQEDIELISIATAKKISDISQYNVYDWMIKNKWNKKLYQAFEEMYKP